MRTTIYSMLLLAVVVLTMANTSARTNNKKPILQNLSSINLYKEFFEYVGAVMGQGIPALNVAPLDPAFLNVTIDIFQQFDPYFPNYTNINVQTTGINISSFSNFEVSSATLSLEDMLANFELYQDEIDLQTYDIVASAVDIDGTLLQYNCSTMYGFVFDGNLTSYKELELLGTYLHVKEFKLDFTSDGVEAAIFNADCTGDDELAFCMLDQIVDVMAEVAFVLIPEYAKLASQEAKIILNDIFALRNVTDNDGDNMPREHVKALLDSMNEITESGISTEAITRSMKKSSHHKSAHKSKDNRFTLKWGMQQFD